MPKVSVIIPTHNDGKYISEAISSVLEQTYSDFEIVVVDDGSIDNTEIIVHQYLNNFPQKIKYFFQKNSGPSAARNKGIREAKGEYIAFLDADDVWLPSKLTIQLSFLESFESIGAVGCGVYDIDESGNIIKVIRGNEITKKMYFCRDLIIRNVIGGGPSGVLIRREVFDKVGLFDESLRGSEDRDMWLRIEEMYEIANIDEPLVKTRIYSDSYSKNTSLIKINHKKFIKKYKHKMKTIGILRAYSYTYLDAAREYYLVSNSKQAILNAFFAIIIFPWRLDVEDDKYAILFKSLLLVFLRKKFLYFFERLKNKIKK
ncbi:MAG: glycosyltransferase [Candidatus Omnitrophica bacterium]|nr:glycosyltransferase [Candidatus Omnitrophota bacterium]